MAHRLQMVECALISLMQAVSIDSSTNYVTVQGGALWQDIYIAAGKCRVALVGGICGNVSVGGSGLMGGYGWLTGAHGLAVDDIVKTEIVLADGGIVTASAAEHSDLYWAIRDAGPCFGIATSLIFQGYS
jgi:FAD/FMN-containing dehydrogenase